MNFCSETFSQLSFNSLAPSNLLRFCIVLKNTIRTNANSTPKTSNGIMKYGFTVMATITKPTMLRITCDKIGNKFKYTLSYVR